MKLDITPRGFGRIEIRRSVQPYDMVRLASASSAVGDYPDALQRPGSSFLWIGEDIHLNREQVCEFRDRLSAWLETGSLRLASDNTGCEPPEAEE